jgi:hypothetical protein
MNWTWSAGTGLATTAGSTFSTVDIFPVDNNNLEKNHQKRTKMASYFSLLTPW